MNRVRLVTIGAGIAVAVAAGAMGWRRMSAGAPRLEFRPIEVVIPAAGAPVPPAPVPPAFAPPAPPAPPPAARPAVVTATARMSAPAAVAVLDARIGTGIQGWEIAGAAATFPAGSMALYCWTHVVGAAGREIVHAWYHGGTRVSTVRLPIAHPSVRTWSTRSIGPGETGAWRVDVLGPDGTMLRSVPFEVR